MCQKRGRTPGGAPGGEPSSIPAEDQQHQGHVPSVLFAEKLLSTQSSYVRGSPDLVSRRGLSTQGAGLGTQRDLRGALSPAGAGCGDLEAGPGQWTEGPSTWMWPDDPSPAPPSLAPYWESSTLGSQECFLPLRQQWF